MNQFQIIACDLDGTLLDSNSEISEANLQAIDELDKIGVQFVPCTGRTFSELPFALKNNGSIRYIIHSNGAVIKDTVTGARVLNFISADTAARVFEAAKLFDTNISIRAGGNLYVKTYRDIDSVRAHYNFSDGHASVITNYGIMRDDFDTFKYSLDDIEVISVLFHSNDEHISFKKLITKMGEVSAVEASECNFEIFSTSAGKGTALLQLADMLSVDRSHTAAVGDSGNDISMLKSAGTGIAVANACDELKAVCDEIICSNDEDAINYVLAKYFNKCDAIK
jgi:Cof subfamily protein (haloacid dehalogenase superfamily)